MVPSRGAISSIYIAVGLMETARDVLFKRFGRDSEALRNLLVGTLVKYPERESRTALRRQPIDGLLNQSIPLVSEQLRLQRFTLSFDPRIAQIPHRAALRNPPMTVFVRGKIACRREKKRPERGHGIALPIGAQKRFLHDLFRRFTRADEASNVSLQCVAALGEELGENLAGGLRGCRHRRVIRLDHGTPLRCCTATLTTRMGDFPFSGVIRIAAAVARPDKRLASR